MILPVCLNNAQLSGTIEVVVVEGKEEIILESSVQDIVIDVEDTTILLESCVNE